MHRIIMLALLMLMAANSASSAGVSKGTLTGSVNINTATVSELMLLPGIGRSRAEAIIAYRQGSAFRSPQELAKIKGIGNKMLARLQNYVAVDGLTTLKIAEAAKLALPAPGATKQ